MFLHERENWWEFRFNKELVLQKLEEVKAKRSATMDWLSTVNLLFREKVTAEAIALELTRSFEIEGIRLNKKSVRASVKIHLGFRRTSTVFRSYFVENLVETLVNDAICHFDEPLTDERLFNWHKSLFPVEDFGWHIPKGGYYRDCEEVVASGSPEHQIIHYMAPSPERVPEEMNRFIEWVNKEDGTDDVIKAAIAHLWFVLIHPFEDGNGRITRAITEMLLARSEHTSERFYSLSNEIKNQQKLYYEVLERVGKGDGDITEWLIFFLDCMNGAFSSTEAIVASALPKLASGKKVTNWA